MQAKQRSKMILILISCIVVLASPSISMGACPSSLDNYLKQSSERLRAREDSISWEEKLVLIEELKYEANKLEQNACDEGASRIWSLIAVFCDVFSSVPKAIGFSDSSKKYYFKAIIALEPNLGHAKQMSEKDSSRLANLYYNTSLFLRKRGELSSAFKFARESLAFRTSKAKSEPLGRTYMLVGILYGRIGEYLQAAKFYRKSLEVYRKGNNKKGEGEALANLCASFSSIPDVDSTKRYSQEALVLKSKSKEIEFTAQYHLARAYFKIGSLAIADSLMRSVKEFVEENKRSLSYTSIANAYNFIGRIHYQKKEFRNALKLYRLTKKEIPLDGSLYIKRNLYQNLAYTFKKLNVPDSSVFFFEQVSTISDSILQKKDLEISNEVKSFLDEIELRKEIKQKIIKIEKDNQLIQNLLKGLILLGTIIVVILYFRQRERQRHKKRISFITQKANERIAQLIVNQFKEEQAKFDSWAKILHNDIQGYFASINMATEDLDESIQNHLKNENNDLADKQWNLIKENTVAGTKAAQKVSYYIRSGHLPPIDEEGVFVKNLNEIIKIYKKVLNINLDIDESIDKAELWEFYFPVNLKIKIFNWVQNALVNVLKHAKASKVKISLSMQKNNLILLIKDNGIGINPKGSWNQWISNTTGIMQIKNEVESFNGTLQMESESGTKLTISIPLKKIEP